MRILDLYCCAGGAAMGYHRAGFQVTGIDVAPRRQYPFDFIRSDALRFLERLIAGELPDRPWLRFDAIHASPPCQAYSNAQRIQDLDHPDLLAPTRERLIETGLPWVIENVEGAPMISPILLCGTMFPGLSTYRHRLFESNVPLSQPAHPEHVYRQTKMGRRPAEDEWIQVVGHMSATKVGRKAMGIDWMRREELREAVPPAYTEFIGRQLVAL